MTTAPEPSQSTLSLVLADLRCGRINASRARHLASLCATRPSPQTAATRPAGSYEPPFGSELSLDNDAAVLAQLQHECALLDQSPYRPGQVIGGRYEVMSVHAGGFGLVCLCRQIGPEVYVRGDGLVALKTPLPRHLATPDLRRMFLTEAAHCVGLGVHPNLVHAYGVEEHNRLPFLVMECIRDASTLADAIHAHATDWRMALRVGVGIARGLAFAGLVHGDLKPVNILLGPTGAPKVADFGLSLGREETTAEGMLAGTLGFMAPEMFAGRPERTIATDVFAFGVTLYAVATRHLAFDPRNPMPLRAADPRRYCADIPAEFADHLLSCLQPDPGSRPAGFAAIAGHLERLHRRLLGVEPPADPAPDTAQRAHAQANLAQTWLHLGDDEKALAAATAAVSADGSSWRAHHALGLVLLESRRPDAAARHFTSASALAPDEVAPLANSALASWRSGNADSARARLAQAARLAHDTDRFGELDSVSQLAIELLPEREAYGFVHAVLTAQPNAAMTWNNRAVLMRRMGAPAIALESADRALALNPAYAHAWVQRANALLDLGQWADALDAADRAVVLDLHLAGAHAAKCAALVAAGRLPEARVCIERGLAVLPSHELLLNAQRGLR